MIETTAIIFHMTYFQLLFPHWQNIKKPVKKKNKNTVRNFKS